VVEMNYNDEDVKKIVKRRTTTKEPFIAFGFIIFLVIGFTIGYFFSGGTNITETTSKQTSLSNFDRVYNTIKENWVFGNQLEEELETVAIKGFLTELGDVHTSYMSKEDSLSFLNSMDNNYSGIGVVVTKIEDYVHVKMVIAGSPAEEVGLKNGDKILRVDSKSVQGISTSELADLVRGDKGTIVTLTIERDGVVKEYQMTRTPLDSSVMYEVRQENGVSFGYLCIRTFGTTSATYVEKALAYFKENQIETIVIDLRDNTGGYLTTVDGILDLFFDNNEILFQVQSLSGTEKYKASSSQKYSFKKGYILVNENTASASEVMAGALQELLDYKLVGTTTYGKGTAQTTITLSDFSTLKYTFAKWLLPSGNSIDGIGLIPDFEVANIDLNKFALVEIEENLVYDSVSDNVSHMQKMLSAVGYDLDREDGYFNETTKRALENFEKDHGLIVDGEYSQEDNLILIETLVSYASQDEHDNQYLRLLELIK